MNPLDIFQGWGSELHILWFFLAAFARFLWKGIGPFGGQFGRLWEQHNEMWLEFHRQKKNEESQQRRVPGFVKE